MCYPVKKSNICDIYRVEIEAEDFEKLRIGSDLTCATVVRFGSFVVIGCQSNINRIFYIVD